jgi:hypothetical protein
MPLIPCEVGAERKLTESEYSKRPGGRPDPAVKLFQSTATPEAKSVISALVSGTLTNELQQLACRSSAAANKAMHSGERHNN